MISLKESVQPAAFLLYKGQQTFSCKGNWLDIQMKEAIGSVLDGLSQKQAADLQYTIPHLRIGLVVELFMAPILVLGHTCLQ